MTGSRESWLRIAVAAGFLAMADVAVSDRLAPSPPSPEPVAPAVTEPAGDRYLARLRRLSIDRGNDSSRTELPSALREQGLRWAQPRGSLLVRTAAQRELVERAASRLRSAGVSITLLPRVPGSGAGSAYYGDEIIVKLRPGQSSTAFLDCAKTLQLEPSRHYRYGDRSRFILRVPPGQDSPTLARTLAASTMTRTRRWNPTRTSTEPSSVSALPV